MPKIFDFDVPNKEEPDFSGIIDKLTHSAAGNSNVGQLRLALVENVDYRKGTVTLFIISDKNRNTVVAYPGFMTGQDGESGLWYGLKKGDLLLCGIGPGNTYYVFNKIGNTSTALQTGSLSDSDVASAILGTYSPTISKDLSINSFLLKSGNVKLKLSDISGAFLGTLGYGSINFDINESADKRYNYTSLISNQFYNITNSGYSINGVISRNKSTNENGDSNSYKDPKIYNDWYKDLKQIGFDNSLMISEQTKGTSKRNPALIEKRNITYEFSDDFFIESDTLEARKQEDVTGKGAKTQINDPLTSRRIRKDDTLSLSLISPNYLIEKIEGTVVDINGNVLDLNRNVLPVGYLSLKTTLAGGTLEDLKALYRRSVAYHWELNARKDPFDINMKVETGEGVDYDKTDDSYKKDRSRFFFDVDKEGQFKLNIPASSEIGNVGLLTRYENYTTINPQKKDGENNYDYFIKNDDAKVDVLLEEIGKGTVSLTGNVDLIAKDRITKNQIKIGTLFHDISKTCVYPIDTADKNRSGILTKPDENITDSNQTQRFILKNTAVDSIVSKELRVDRAASDKQANAGGRSGTIGIEGMLNVSVGANTADKQSLWVDFQGGIVQRIGCDKNGISSATQTDGDMYIQIGGDPGFRNTDGSISDQDPDPRFGKSLPGNENIVVPSSNKTNVFEIRVIQGNGQYCRIRVDNFGVIISSPKNIELRSDESIILTAGGDIRLNPESSLKFYGDDVTDLLATPLHRQSRKFEDVYTPDPGGGRELIRPYIGSQDVL